MKPCSAYCEPERGIHATIGWTDAPDSELDALRLAFVGRVDTAEGECCFETPATQTILAIERAVECDETSPFPGCPRPVLTTVLVEPVAS